ncbi:SDR family NAD(P)-dependent oxidoreductase [Shinella sp. BYT-45]|uniref:SDR family NAD(P)-dependent oxidoreductase n=1 Tax=Shinella sp. BYT-45 TaxID=3377377 RepID=UPI003980F647
MRSVIVLGGYGGFGARLSRRLAADGWAVLVAGRNAAAAERLAAELPEARPLVADRNDDLRPLLALHRPFLLVDAAGPFQGSGY